MNSILQFSFFYYSISISIILSFLFALISFIIVIKRLAFLAIGTEHAAFGGAGIARVMGWDVFATTMIFCTVITVFAGRTHRKYSDTGTSLFFSAAMGFGMILLSLKGGSQFNLISFLFGDIIGITYQELIFAFFTTLLVYIIILPSLGKIIFLIFDRDFAVISGVNESFWDTITYMILSVSVILAIKLVGVLLVSAMTVLPGTFALLWKKNVKGTLIISFCFTLFSMVGGVLLSCILDIAPGALIVGLGVLAYFLSRIAISMRGMKNDSME